MTIEVIEARWDAPARVRAFTTIRAGGVSRSPFDSLNLAHHVHDDEPAVQENRRRLVRQCRLPGEPVWLRQVHGTAIAAADTYAGMEGADGGFTSTPRVVCAILTADCLPLFLCDGNGGRVGLFHIGWRGLAQGLVGKAAGLFGQTDAMAWLGPAIGPAAFEVGDEVKSAIELALGARPNCFEPGDEGKWIANLYALAAEELQRRGIACSYDASLCTYTDETRFFSYRRSASCGRMASVIWIDA